MSFLTELKLFLRTFTDWLLLLGIFTVFFFSFNVESVTVMGTVKPLPVPAEESFAAEFFNSLVADVAPADIPLVVTSPTAAFVVQVKLAFLLALIFTFPVFLWRLASYLAPALRSRERQALALVVGPSLILFAVGVAFAYHTIAPVTLSILYGFTGPIGVVPLLGIVEFVGVVAALLLIAGCAFTIPVFMVLMTALGVISTAWWLARARYAIVGILVVSAIITPDGSGVSMLLLSVPVTVLYGAGIVVSAQVERAANRSRRAQPAKHLSI